MTFYITGAVYALGGTIFIISIFNGIKKSREKIVDVTPDDLLKFKNSLKVKEVVDVEYKRKFWGPTIIIYFEKDPNFSTHMKLPLTHKGCSIETKIIKRNRK